MTASAIDAVTMTVNGVAVTTRDTFEVRNPATGAVCGRAPDCAPDDLDTALRAAADAAPAWAADEAGRREALRAAGKTVSAAAQRLGAIVTAEQGKPLAMAIGEAFGAAAGFRYHAGLALPAQVLRDDRRGHVEVEHRPLGVVAAITPWNFPVAIAAATIAPALLAGNTVVLKPSPFAPLATLVLGELLRDVLPPGVCNVVSGSDALGAALVAHDIPAHVSFTGSVDTGRQVAGVAAAGCKRLTLELGGNDPGIVLPDADPEALAEKLFWESFGNCGQACMLIKRLYVPDSLYEPMVDALAAKAATVVVGDGAVKGTELGPVTTEPQLRRVAGLVADAVRAGARVAAGGHQPDRPGQFYAPTVLADAGDDMAVVAQEQFGPVLPVVRYHCLDDAVRAANATRFGLGGSVWSADPDRAWDVAARLECGTVWVNTHAELAPDQPYGGLKCSGIGVAGGLPGVLGYTATRVRCRPAQVSPL